MFLDMQDSLVFAHILNFYDVLLLTTAVLAFFLALPLLMKRDRQINDTLLALFVLSQGFYAFFTVMAYNIHLGPLTKALLFPFYKLPDMLLLGIQGLLLLWYTRAMMGRNIAMRSPTTFIVVGLTIVAAFINYFVVSSGLDQVYLLIACGLTLNICAVVVGIKALHQLRGYELRLPFIHSNLNKHSLTWLRTIAAIFVAMWVFPVLAFFFKTSGADNIAEGFYLFRHIPPLILISIMVVYSQTHAISKSTHLAVMDDKKAANDNHSVNPELARQLIDLMERVKVYQDPELRLEGLADSLGISPRSLSTLLNRHHKKNFYDFVNHYRVLDAESQLKMPENEDKPIQRVFEDAGFNSKTTFNTLFKKYTGQTPSVFRKQHGQLKSPKQLAV